LFEYNTDLAEYITPYNIYFVSLETVVFSAQCLYTLSEENQTVSEFLQQTSNSQTLTSLLRNDKVLLYTRVIIAGKLALYIDICICWQCCDIYKYLL